MPKGRKKRRGKKRITIINVPKDNWGAILEGFRKMRPRFAKEETESDGNKKYGLA